MNNQWHWAVAAHWWVKSYSWIDRSRTIWSILLFDGVPKHTSYIRGERICRAFVCGKICQRQRDSTVISFQLLLDLLLYGYNSSAGALQRMCLMLLQSFSRQKWSWSVNIQACCQQGLEQNFHSAKKGRRLFSQCSSLKKSWRLTASCSIASPCHIVLLFPAH